MNFSFILIAGLGLEDEAVALPGVMVGGDEPVVIGCPLLVRNESDVLFAAVVAALIVVPPGWFNPSWGSLFVRIALFLGWDSCSLGRW